MVDWQSMFAERVGRMKASDIRDAFKLSERPDIISFAGGFPAPSSFPVQSIGDVMSSLLAEDAGSALQYGPTEGLYELRSLVAASMSREGVPTKPENVLITSGSQQALDLLCKVFVDPSSPVIVELPGYIGGISAAANYQADFLGVPLDADGLQVDVLAEKLAKWAASGRTMPRLAYVVPNFQNPTGVTLKAERRQRLVELANEYNFLIIEDNPYGSLRFVGEAVPHIKSFDTEGRVFYLGSFSKTFLPGVRLGWVVADEEVIGRLTVAKQGTDLCSNSLGQKLVCEYDKVGLLQPHVSHLQGMYLQKRNVALAALERYFPAGVTWTVPEGGFFIWVTLPTDCNARTLLPDAVAHEHVAYVPGGAFFVDGSGENTFRLAYSQAEEADLVEGIKRLGRFLFRVLDDQVPLAAASEAVAD